MSDASEALDRLWTFIAEAGLGASALTRRRVEYYFGAGVLREPLHVFTLPTRPRSLIERAEGSLGADALPVDAVLDSVAALLPIDLARFLRALSIPGVTAAEVDAVVTRAGGFDGLLELQPGEALRPPLGTDPAGWSAIVCFFCTAKHQRKLREIREQAPSAIAAPRAVREERKR